MDWPRTAASLKLAAVLFAPLARQIHARHEVISKAGRVHAASLAVGRGARRIDGSHLPTPGDAAGRAAGRPPRGMDRTDQSTWSASAGLARG